ncbi:hypothetical protein M885DRAFT_576815 [Pelagophyceae sp. CCMP2097]|nr:hypothetical protein M885DRAFT_576815 [Pelagophyceae sp. CCMP2097]
MSCALAAPSAAALASELALEASGVLAHLAGPLGAVEAAVARAAAGATVAEREAFDKSLLLLYDGAARRDPQAVEAAAALLSQDLRAAGAADADAAVLAMFVAELRRSRVGYEHMRALFHARLASFADCVRADAHLDARSAATAEAAVEAAVNAEAFALCFDASALSVRLGAAVRDKELELLECKAALAAQTHALAEGAAAALRVERQLDAARARSFDAAAADHAARALPSGAGADRDGVLQLGN